MRSLVDHLQAEQDEGAGRVNPHSHREHQALALLIMELHFLGQAVSIPHCLLVFPGAGDFSSSDTQQAVASQHLHAQYPGQSTTGAC